MWKFYLILLTAYLSNSVCSFYKTALKEITLEDLKAPDKPDDSVNEDNSVNDKIITLKKRKRVRRRKPKKSSEVFSESDMILTEETCKKTRIIDSIVISSAKYIRFEDIKGSTDSYNGIQNKNDEVP